MSGLWLLFTEFVSCNYLNKMMLLMFATISDCFEDKGPIKLFFHNRLKIDDLTVPFLI